MIVTEFYEDGSDLKIASFQADVPLREGDLICVRKIVWVVVDVTFTLDHADDPALKTFRRNVYLKQTSS